MGWGLELELDLDFLPSLNNSIGPGLSEVKECEPIGMELGCGASLGCDLSIVIARCLRNMLAHAYTIRLIFAKALGFRLRLINRLDVGFEVG